MDEVTDAVIFNGFVFDSKIQIYLGRTSSRI